MEVGGEEAGGRSEVEEGNGMDEEENQVWGKGKIVHVEAGKRREMMIIDVKGR